MHEIKLGISVTVKHMFLFQLRHAYKGIQGTIAIVVSIGALLIYILTMKQNENIVNFALIFSAVLFTIIVPLNLLYKSYFIISRSPVLMNELIYDFTNTGIGIEQKNDKVEIPWSDITKVERQLGLLLFYTSPQNAYIIPLDQCLEKKDQIREIIKNNTELNLWKEK